MAKRSICTIKKADIDELGFRKLSNGPLASNQGGGPSRAYAHCGNSLVPGPLIITKLNSYFH